MCSGRGTERIERKTGEGEADQRPAFLSPGGCGQVRDSKLAEVVFQRRGNGIVRPDRLRVLPHIARQLARQLEKKAAHAPFNVREEMARLAAGDNGKRVGIDRAKLPRKARLSFGVLFCVVRSTAMRPKVMEKPFCHSKLSIRLQWQ